MKSRNTLAPKKEEYVINIIPRDVEQMVSIFEDQSQREEFANDLTQWKNRDTRERVPLACTRIGKLLPSGVVQEITNKIG